jgi:hypothetical protein
MSTRLRATLCDSRSCNQTGGGEYLKGDIEDLLQLVSDTGKVTLTTCMGLCNNSPNMILESKGNSLQSQQGRLVNDGGFRMQVEALGEHVKSNKAVISEITISKVAKALGERI